MKPTAWICVVGLMLGTFGCVDRGERSASRDAGASPPAAAGSASSVALSQPQGGIPPALERAEALAEVIQDDIAQGAWDSAGSRERELRRSNEELESAGVPAAKRSALGNTLDFLVVAIAERRRPEALTAANRVSQVVTDVMAGYPTKVPIDVAYMDVATRDILYDTEQQRWSRAAEGGAELLGHYTDVQAHVRTRDPALDRRVVSEIDQLRRAVDARAQARAATLAKALLDDVDRIEQSFLPAGTSS